MNKIKMDKKNVMIIVGCGILVVIVLLLVLISSTVSSTSGSALHIGFGAVKPLECILSPDGEFNCRFVNGQGADITITSVEAVNIKHPAKCVISSRFPTTVEPGEEFVIEGNNCVPVDVQIDEGDPVDINIILIYDYKIGKIESRMENGTVRTCYQPQPPEHPYIKYDAMLIILFILALILSAIAIKEIKSKKQIIPTIVLVLILIAVIILIFVLFFELGTFTLPSEMDYQVKKTYQLKVMCGIAIIGLIAYIMIRERSNYRRVISIRIRPFTTCGTAFVNRTRTYVSYIQKRKKVTVNTLYRTHSFIVISYRYTGYPPNS